MVRYGVSSFYTSLTNSLIVDPLKADAIEYSRNLSKLIFSKKYSNDS
jgi:hypothetical protein